MYCFSWITQKTRSLGTFQASHTYSGFSRDSLGKKWHLLKSVMPSEAPQHYGECVRVGSTDGKVSAGELRLQAGGDANQSKERDTERVCRRREEETRGHERALAPAPKSLVRCMHTHSQLKFKDIFQRYKRLNHATKTAAPSQQTGPHLPQRQTGSCKPEAHSGTHCFN